MNFWQIRLHHKENISLAPEYFFFSFLFDGNEIVHSEKVIMCLQHTCMDKNSSYKLNGNLKICLDFLKPELEQQITNLLLIKYKIRNF